MRTMIAFLLGAAVGGMFGFLVATVLIAGDDL